MGNLANGLWWMDNGDSSWCSTKCAVDKDFRMPYVNGDSDLFIQLDLYATGIQQNAFVKELHVCLLDGTRVIPNLLQTWGPAYYKSDRNATNLNLFTFRLPADFGACAPVLKPTTVCTCYFIIDDDQYGNLAYIIIDGVSYPVASGAGAAAAPGFIGSEATTGGNWKIIYNCEIETSVILFQGSTGEPYAPAPNKDCFDITCECYYLFEEFEVLNTDKITVNGVAYEDTDILLTGAALGFQPAVLQGSGQYKVMVDCAYETASVLFYGGSGIYGKGIIKENCNPVTIDLTCFMFEAEVAFTDFPTAGGPSFYTEPYECVKCENTLKIGGYYGTDFDTMGLWNFNHAKHADPALSFGGLEVIGNAMRIPAIVRNLPARFSVTKNDKCFTYKSEVVRIRELQGTKAYPPYFADFVTSCLTAHRFRINGREHQVRGDQAFETIGINGMSAYKLKAQIEECANTVYFDCA